MAKRLKLGLDLRGGVHLVLRVKTDEALRFFWTKRPGASASESGVVRGSRRPSSPASMTVIDLGTS